MATTVRENGRQMKRSEASNRTDEGKYTEPRESKKV